MKLQPWVTLTLQWWTLLVGSGCLQVTVSTKSWGSLRLFEGKLATPLPSHLAESAVLWTESLLCSPGAEGGAGMDEGFFVSSSTSTLESNSRTIQMYFCFRLKKVQLNIELKHDSVKISEFCPSERRLITENTPTRPSSLPVQTGTSEVWPQTVFICRSLSCSIPTSRSGKLWPPVLD